MSNGTERAKWVGMWLLQIPIYIVTSYLIRTLMGSCYRLIVRSGANVPPNFLLQHFLWVGLVGGFVAGLAGLQILRATLLLLPPATSPVAHLPWKWPQAWTWVLTTLWMAYGVSAWFGGHVHHSVLADSAAGRPDVIAAFFGNGCFLGGWRFDTTLIDACMPQLSFTHPWIGTIGYSAAAFFPSTWIGRLRKAEILAETSAEQGHQEQVVS